MTSAPYLARRLARVCSRASWNADADAAHASHASTVIGARADDDARAGNGAAARRTKNDAKIAAAYLGRARGAAIVRTRVRICVSSRAARYCDETSRADAKKCNVMSRRGQQNVGRAGAASAARARCESSRCTVAGRTGRCSGPVWRPW